MPIPFGPNIGAGTPGSASFSMGMGNPFAALLGGSGGGLNFTPSTPAPAAPPAPAPGSGLPQPRNYNPLFDPNAPGLFGIIGRLSGNPTRDEFRQQQAGAAQNDAYQELAMRVQQGMSPQKALADYIRSPSGAYLFATDPNAQATISNALTMLQTPPEVQQAEIRQRIMGGGEGTATAQGAQTPAPRTHLLDPRGIARMTDGIGAAMSNEGTIPMPGAQAQAPSGQMSRRDTLLAKAEQLFAAGDLKGAEQLRLMADAYKDEDRGRLVEVVVPGKGNVWMYEADAAGLPAPEKQPMFANESAFQKELGTAVGQDVAKVITRSDSYAQLRPLVANLQATLDSGGFTPGAFGSVRAGLSTLAEGLGLDPEAGILNALGLGDPNAAQQMESIANQIAMTMANNFEGLRSTNMSLEMLSRSIPNLTKTPGGMQLMINLIDTQANRAAQAKDALYAFMEENGSVTTKNVGQWQKEYDALKATWAEEDKLLSDQIREMSKEGRFIGFDSIVGAAEKANESFDKPAEIPTFKSDVEAKAALRRGEIKPGQEIIVNGVRGSF